MTPKNRSRGRPKSFDRKAAQTTIQSLDRAFDVLDALAAGGAMTLSQVAAELDQAPATIYRVLTTLQLREVVETNPATQSWAIGPAAFRLGSSFLRRSSVAERSRPLMRQLMEATGETSNLGIEKSDMVLFVSQVETQETIRAFFPPGTQSPMHASGIGKALLSCYPADRLERLLDTRPLERFTEQTITRKDHLHAELRDIRARGFSFDNEERTPGMRCIAAPILNFHGEAVAGISVSGPANRMTLDQTDQIGRQVREAAETLSRSLGAADPDRSPDP